MQSRTACLPHEIATHQHLDRDFTKDLEELIVIHLEERISGGDEIIFGSRLLPTVWEVQLLFLRKMEDELQFIDMVDGDCILNEKAETYSNSHTFWVKRLHAALIDHLLMPTLQQLEKA